MAASLGGEDEVEFEVVVNRRSGGHRAEALELLCKAQDRRELGQVCLFWPHASLDWPQC